MVNINRIFFLVSILIYSCSFDERQEESAESDEINVDFNYKKWGHSQFNLFIYKVKQTDSNNRVIRQDTLGLFCTDIPKSPKSEMTQTQWQFLTTDSLCHYTLDLNRYTGHYEGTNSFGDELFLHPARSCIKMLQLCPYPYFQNKRTWDWDFEVGAHWGVDSLYPITTTEVFHITYTWEHQEEQLNGYFRELKCRKLNAVSKSIFGTSHASYYMNEEHGLVYFTVTAVNKQSFEFSLMNKIEGKDAMAEIAPFFVSDHNRSKGIQELLLMK